MSSTTNIGEKLSSDTSNLDFETHDYPSNKQIIYKTSRHSFIYDIIKEGVYPDNPKYTQVNSNRNQHPIPDEYLVETEFGKKKNKLRCSINYYNNKPVFYLYWKDIENKNHQVTSEKSATDATRKYLKVFR
jgi:hypothetical protein